MTGALRIFSEVRAMSDAPYIDVSDQLRLLGTAHVATSSVEAVQHHIDAFAPDVVAVELCPTRYEALRSDRRLDREGLRRVMKEGKAPLVLLQAFSLPSSGKWASMKVNNRVRNCWPRWNAPEHVTSGSNWSTVTFRPRCEGHGACACASASACCGPACGRRRRGGGLRPRCLAWRRRPPQRPHGGIAHHFSRCR